MTDVSTYEQSRKLDEALRVVKCTECLGLPDRGERQGYIPCGACGDTGLRFPSGIGSWLESHGGEWPALVYFASPYSKAPNSYGIKLLQEAPVYPNTYVHAVSPLTVLEIYEAVFGWRWEHDYLEKHTARWFAWPEHNSGIWTGAYTTATALVDAIQQSHV